MGLLSLPRFETRSTLTPGAKLSDPALIDMFRGQTSASGQNVTSDTAMRVSTVYACVGILSKTLAMLEKYIKGVRPDGGKDILYNHRLYKLIHNKPNRWQSGYDFFAMMESHRQLRGNCYARIMYYPGRGLNELVPMHPDRVWPFVVTPSGITQYMAYNSPPPPQGSKLYFQYFSSDGNTEILTDYEVFRVMGYSINGIVGMNPITKAAAESIGLAMATEEQGARLFSNGAQFGVVIKHPTQMSPMVYSRMKEEINSKIQNAANANKPFFLEEGMDIANLTMTMDNAQFLETRGFQVEDIARFFNNMPLFLLGHGDKAPTFASAKEFMIAFKIFTMQPNVKNWEDALERDLLYPDEMNKIKIDIDLDSLMRGDPGMRSAYLRDRFSMASMSPNDVRLYEEENPADDEGAGELYIMSNMLPLKNAGITKQAGQVPAVVEVKNGN